MTKYQHEDSLIVNKYHALKSKETLNEEEMAELVQLETYMENRNAEKKDKK